jgi:Uma2 family endonuclease
MTVVTESPPTQSSTAQPKRSDDRLITLKGDWAHFKLIQQGCEQNSGTQLFYFDGTIEILMPGRPHEIFSHIIGYLLSGFLAHQGILFSALGSANQEAEGTAASQPDQSYCIGSVKPIPDLSIEINSRFATEVVFTSGGIDKLQRYQAIGVPEVWFWEDGTLRLYHLRVDGYERIEQSELEGLKTLDLTILKRHIMMAETNQGEAILSFTTYASTKKST